MADSKVRQRKGADKENGVKAFDAAEGAGAEPPVKAASKAKTSKIARNKADKEDKYSPWVDVLRVITFLMVASCGLSYLITGGESWFWGLKHSPKYFQLNYWKSRFSLPIYLTIEELSTYDGTDLSKPMYLAINGTIYDVSINRKTYGPGGSYHWAVGTDASRAYLTGCFEEDRTGDMRGVEEMYMPIDDYETDRQFTVEELRAMRKKERAEAKERAHESLKHWVQFFANSEKKKGYFKVGYVRRPKDWPKGEPRPKLCDYAQEQRPKRKLPESDASE